MDRFPVLRQGWFWTLLGGIGLTLLSLRLGERAGLDALGQAGTVVGILLAVWSLIRGATGGQVSELREDIGGVRRDVREVGAKVEEVGAKVDALGAKVEEVGAKVDALGAKVDGVGAKIDALGGKMDQTNALLREIRDRLGDRQPA